MIFCNLLLTFSLSDVSLLIDIFKYKNIKNGVIFHCYDKHIVNSVHKVFNDNGIRVANAEVYYNATFNVTKSYPKVGIVMDTGCEGWTSILDTKTLSFQEYSFVIISKHLSEATDVFSRYPVEVDSDVIIAHKMDTTFNLYEVYNTGFRYNGNYNVRKIGHWNSSLFIKDSDRKDLQGVCVKTAVVILASPKIVNQTIEQYMEKPIKSQIEVDTVHRMKYFLMLKDMRDMYNIR